MPRIVVGVDASPDSKAALAWAAGEARLRQAVLQVVFAFHARELGAPEYVPTQHGLPGAGVNPSLEGFDAGFVAEPDMTGTLRDRSKFEEAARSMRNLTFLAILVLLGMYGLLFLAFTLPQVDILMPTKKPRGQELTLEQQLTNQALDQRRLRIEHVHSSVKRCRIIKDRLRLWKKGIRDLVMELCSALHNFRVRLNPWQPMV